MKFKYLILILIFSFSGYSQDNFCQKLNKINSILQKEHYKPRIIDDSLSVNWFDTFIDEFDADNTIFTKSEYQEIEKFKFKLDDLLNSNDCSFIDAFEKTIKKGLLRKLEYIKKIEKQKLDFTGIDTLYYSPKKVLYSENENKLLLLIKKKIELTILSQIASISKNKDSLNKEFKKLLPKYQHQLIEKEKCIIEFELGKNQNFKQNIENLFLSTFVSCFDPHSNYFNATQKNLFLNSVSEENLTFGIDFLLDDENNLIIANIKPGSSAFKSSKLSLSDKLVKIKTSQNEIWSDCNNFNEILNVIHNNQNKSILFTFSNNKKEYQVNLEQSFLKEFDNKCYSFIINKNNENFGYLNIPSFYSDESELNSMSNDVAFEINKLNKENIKGLIIDLQNNGGGNIYEAIKLTGMFIDIGPVALLTQKNNQNQILRDINRGTYYQGPIVVLVNEQSASASELFANTIQDYKRGIIVGNRTFGKATMQEIIKIDSLSYDSDFLKVTKEQFFRITGKSNQEIGLKPDVEIPSIYESHIQYENNLPFAIKNESITSKARYQTWYKNYFSKILLLNEKIRENENFKNVLELKSKFENLKEIKPKKIALNFEQVFNLIHQNDIFFEEVENFSNTIHFEDIFLNKEDQTKFKNDSYLYNIFEERLKLLKRNYAFAEAINVIYEIKND